MSLLFQYQDEVLKKLAGQMDDFYLAGGTALAKFYFQHRESYDLDFFTQNYSAERIEEITRILARGTGKKLKLKSSSERTAQKTARWRIYDMVLDQGALLKIDFVEDVLPLIRPFKNVDRINILSQEDIYLRKIYAVSGSSAPDDRTGKRRFLGGRQEAKDLFDLYHLSMTFQNLSVFMQRHCEPWMKEGVINWFHRFSRSEMKMGLMEINTTNVIEFSEIDRHFRKEMDRLIGGMTG